MKGGGLYRMRFADVFEVDILEGEHRHQLFLRTMGETATLRELSGVPVRAEHAIP